VTAADQPRLDLPIVAVRDSFLAGSRALCAEEGTSSAWLDEAAADFGRFVAARIRGREMWGVPVTELWYVRGSEYIGTVMIRHELTPALRQDGGNVGYHVVPGYRRQGHATAMLAAACARCRLEGMTRLLVTCGRDNTGSRLVIEATGGVPDEPAGDILRYWIELLPPAGQAVSISVPEGALAARPKPRIALR
jgi:predicted acetyltransferase